MDIISSVNPTSSVASIGTHGGSGSSYVMQEGFEARTSDPTAVSSGQAVRGIASLLGKQVVMPYAAPNRSQSFCAPSGAWTDNTSHTIFTAVLGSRNYMTGLDVVNTSSTVTTEVTVTDGTTGPLWRTNLQPGQGLVTEFNPPLKGSVNTLMAGICGTSGSQTYLNARGFLSTEG